MFPLRSRLDLSNNDYSTVLPSFPPGSAPWLTVLDLSGNRFRGEIPASYAAIPMLTSLSLGDNELTGGLPVFPPGSPLQFLVVNNNNLSGPLPAMELGSLLVLDLTSNGFSGPLDLTRLRAPVLMDLRLGGNRFGCPIVVPASSRIQRLSLGSNLFNESCAGGMGFLSGMAHVQVFDGSDNDWGGELPLYLPGEMRSFHCLRCALDTPLPATWQYHPTLSLLFLSGNRVRGTMFTMPYGLTTLDLSGCGFSGDIFMSFTYMVSGSGGRTIARTRTRNASPCVQSAPLRLRAFPLRRARAFAHVSPRPRAPVARVPSPRPPSPPRPPWRPDGLHEPHVGPVSAGARHVEQ